MFNFVKRFGKSFSKSKFTFVMCWIDFIIINLQPWFHWSIVKFAAFIYSYFVRFAFCLDSSEFLWKALVIVIRFLYFRGITHVYLLKILITYNKKRTPLSNLLIHCASARLAPKNLSIKHECNFRFLDFLIIV